MTSRVVAAILVAALASSCSSLKAPLDFVEYESFDRALTAPTPTPDLRERFNREIPAQPDSLTKPGVTLSGFVTENRRFLDSVMLPHLTSRSTMLRARLPAEALNALILFTHETYRTWFGPGFYRWGGDILDLDDPQEHGTRVRYRYGLDCSGFASAPYELAVRTGILRADDSAAVFSSAGFAHAAAQRGINDEGGRNGTPNRFRVDTHDFLRLGREVFRVARGTSPTEVQLGQLQPGDIVGRTGHVGIIAMINGEPYYLESGGSVLPRNGNLPHKAGPALTIFARQGELVVRRALP